MPKNSDKEAREILMEMNTVATISVNINRNFQYHFCPILFRLTNESILYEGRK